MKLYSVSGTLMQGFLGNIIYETILPENTRQLSLRVRFGKRERESWTEEDLEACRQAWRKNTGRNPGEEELERLVHAQKAEINVSVFHNGAYLGCAHRDDVDKRILIGPEGASRGFRNWKPAGGVLRVVLHVYQILNDETPYSIAAKAYMQEDGRMEAKAYEISES